VSAQLPPPPAPGHLLQLDALRKERQPPAEHAAVAAKSSSGAAEHRHPVAGEAYRQLRVVLPDELRRRRAAGTAAAEVAAAAAAPAEGVASEESGCEGEEVVAWVSLAPGGQQGGEACVKGLEAEGLGKPRKLRLMKHLKRVFSR
jgi:hypothetical protein